MARAVLKDGSLFGKNTIYFSMLYHGYLLFIDSNYRDIKNNNNTFVTQPDNDEDISVLRSNRVSVTFLTRNITDQGITKELSSLFAK